MFTKSYNNNIYIGRKAGKILAEEIGRARKFVKVVSPYLSPYYVKKLIELQKSGIDVTLITSDDIETNSSSDFTHHDLIFQKKHTNNKAKKKRNTNLLIGWSILSLAFILLLFVFTTPSIIIISVIFTVIGISLLITAHNTAVYTYSYQTTLEKLRVYEYNKFNFDERKSTAFIHSKIYIIDDRLAFLGSVNLSKMGMSYNYESMIMIKEPSAVKDISKEVDRLYNGIAGSKDITLEYKDIDEWGKSIYEEPIH